MFSDQALDSFSAFASRDFLRAAVFLCIMPFLTALSTEMEAALTAASALSALLATASLAFFTEVLTADFAATFLA
jgi:hypothetical protein